MLVCLHTYYIDKGGGAHAAQAENGFWRISGQRDQKSGHHTGRVLYRGWNQKAVFL